MCFLMFLLWRTCLIFSLIFALVLTAKPNPANTSWHYRRPLSASFRSRFHILSCFWASSTSGNPEQWKHRSSLSPKLWLRKRAANASQLFPLFNWGNHWNLKYLWTCIALLFPLKIKVYISIYVNLSFSILECFKNILLYFRALCYSRRDSSVFCCVLWSDICCFQVKQMFLFWNNNTKY